MNDEPNPVPERLLKSIQAATEAVIFYEHKIRQLELQLREAKVSRSTHKQRLDMMLKRAKPLTKKEKA